MTITLRASDKTPHVFFDGDDLPPEHLKVLEDVTSFFPSDFERTEKFQRGQWDGRVRLMRRAKNGHMYVPIGLLSTVESVLTKLGHHIDVDMPLKPSPCIGLKWFGPELYPHQTQAVLEAMYELNRGRGCIIDSPTGSGKTVMALKIIQMLDVPTLIIVNTGDLMTQWSNAIDEKLHIVPNIYRGKKKEVGGITISTVQTLYNRLKSNELSIDIFNFLCVDEIHRYSAKNYKYVVMNCPSFYRLGLSATPRNRSDGRDLQFYGGVSTKIVKTVTAPELIENELMAIPEFFWLRSPRPRVVPNSWQQLQKWAIDANEGRNKMIIEAVKKIIVRGGSTYVSVFHIAHGKYIADAIPGSVFLSGEDSDKKRDDTIQKFKEKKIMCIVSTILGEGIDIPSMNCFVNAGGGKSEIGTIQRVGRALRKSDGKTSAVVIDFVDSVGVLAQHSAERRNTYIQLFGADVVMKHASK